MQRITEKDLEAVCKRINIVTGSPESSYTKQYDGHVLANVGNYHLSYAYGGVTLYRMHNSGGGVQDILSSGYTTKRDLYNQMHAFLRGIESKKEKE